MPLHHSSNGGGITIGNKVTLKDGTAGELIADIVEDIGKIKTEIGSIINIRVMYT